MSARDAAHARFFFGSYTQREAGWVERGRWCAVWLMDLVSDLLIQHEGLSFCRPEDQSLKPLEVVLVDDASHDLKVAIESLRLLNRWQQLILGRVHLRVQSRPLLSHLKSLLQGW